MEAKQRLNHAKQSGLFWTACNHLPVIIHVRNKCAFSVTRGIIPCCTLIGKFNQMMTSRLLPIVQKIKEAAQLQQLTHIFYSRENQNSNSTYHSHRGSAEYIWLIYSMQSIVRQCFSITLHNREMCTTFEVIQNTDPCKNIRHSSVNPETYHSILIDSRSRHTDRQTTQNFATLSHITATTPSTKLDTNTWKFPEDIKLPDEPFDQPGSIDLLIGADLFFKMLQSTSEIATIPYFLVTERCELKFITPHVPHFGGLCEAAVKSLKFHLRRTPGSQVSTFKELCTLRGEIESCMNSRSLSALFDHSLYPTYLSPGQILIGEPRNQLPAADLTNVKFNRLPRWQT